MGRNVRVEINHEGVKALLKSPLVAAELERRAKAIAAKAGPGMEVSVHYGRNRVNASVITATTEARVAEAKDRALTRAIDAGRA